MAATTGHLAYELVSGVALPMASRVGIFPAAATYGAGAVTAYLAAGTATGLAAERAFAAANGVFLAAVATHFTTWPHAPPRWAPWLPWLAECEGLRGRLMPPYNVILHVSAGAAVGGLVENRRGLRWGVGAGVLVFPLLRAATPVEYDRLLEQAARRPRWWNRRLRHRLVSGRGPSWSPTRRAPGSCRGPGRPRCAAPEGASPA